MHDIIDWDEIETSVKKALGPDNKGWVRIVTHALEKVKERCDEKEIAHPKIGQIKEKLGDLRIYYSEPTKDMYVRAFMEDARIAANSFCERCGNICRPQNLGGWIRCLCCFCAHQVAEDRGYKKPEFNQFRPPEDGHLQCTNCGYVGQIAWTASGHRCPACVSKGWG